MNGFSRNEASDDPSPPSAGLRNRLVHEYDAIEDGLILQSVAMAEELYSQYVKEIKDYLSTRDVDIELWAQVKQKATIERKTMRDVIFEGLRLYLNPPASESVKAKPKRKAKV